MGVLHQPNNRNRKIKRVSRLVVLPDYQGIGIGYKFLTVIAKIYRSEGWDFSIVTSAKNLITKLYSDNNWLLCSCDYAHRPTTDSIEMRSKTLRTNCKTASFRFRG